MSAFGRQTADEGGEAISASGQQALQQVDVARVRRALLRYQPASNWVSLARDPTPRMTIGFGFDVGRAKAAETLAKVGLDPGAVRGGRTPISDAQMHELFDIELLAAVQSAGRRVPGFAAMDPENHAALLELIMWLGPDGTDAVFSELEHLSLPLTQEIPEPSTWFDQAAKATPPPVEPRSTLRGWSGSISQTARRARQRYKSNRRSRYATTFEAFGVVGELASDDRDLLRAAEGMLPPGWGEDDGQPDAWFGVWTDGSITVNGARADWAAHGRPSLLKLGAIVRHYLATHAPSFTFVHAGVVEVGGCGIVIPGRSHSGKSTLVAELVRLGALYASDEYAVVDPSGLVHPFAKPLSIRAGRNDPLGQPVPVPEDRVASGPITAGLVVLTSYAAGAQWRPCVGSRAEGALALLENTVSARVRPAAALRATSRLVHAAVFLAGQRGEASDAAQAVLETALRQSGTWTTVLA
jgi:hypothetical protein